MGIPLVDIKQQYQTIKSDIDTAVMSLLDSGQFILGQAVQRLEKEVSELCESRHAIGVASGTDALLLSLKALQIGPGDEVIVPPFTFFATAGAVHNAGAKTVFVDIDPVTYNIDPDRIAKAITKHTKAIIPVHLFGQCADMDPILDIARKHSLAVIEDSAQSLGAAYKGKAACSIGLTGCISFFPTKNLGGYGDGGMVTTNDDDLAARLRMLRVHGEVAKYVHREVGLNSRLDGLQAAIISAKIPYLKTWNEKRREHALVYNELFKDSPVVTPVERDGDICIYNQYTIRAANRDAILKNLSSKGIGCAVYYPVPLHLQECFRYLGYSEGDFPESERAAHEVISLPVFPELTHEQQEEIVAAVKEVL